MHIFLHEYYTTMKSYRKKQKQKIGPILALHPAPPFSGALALREWSHFPSVAQSEAWMVFPTPSQLPSTAAQASLLSLKPTRFSPPPNRLFLTLDLHLSCLDFLSRLLTVAPASSLVPVTHSHTAARGTLLGCKLNHVSGSPLASR